MTNILSKIYENYDIQEMENSSILVAKGRIVLPDNISSMAMKTSSNKSSYPGTLFSDMNCQKTESGILLFK